MATVRDLMTRDVVTLGPEMSLREAIEVLRAREVTGAPVVAGSGVVGVLSAADILEFTATSPGVPVFHAADEIEWGAFESPADEWPDDVSPSTYYAELWPDAGADVWERFDSLDGPEWDQFAEHPVSELMSRVVRTVTPDTELHRAAEIMLEAEVHRLVVVDDAGLVGIVSTSDIVRAVAHRQI